MGYGVGWNINVHLQLHIRLILHLCLFHPFSSNFHTHLIDATLVPGRIVDTSQNENAANGKAIGRV